MDNSEMIVQRLDALVAAEKLKIASDPIYHVLADITHILDAAYRMSGVGRPRAQVQAESMDIMLDCLSGDRDEISTDYYKQRIAEEVVKYRPLSETFFNDLSELIDMRREKVEQMSPEERAEASFAAYLGSLNTTEEMWRDSRREEAARLVEEDIRLDTFASEAKIEVSEDEIETAYLELAGRCDVTVDTVREQLDPLSLVWQIRRDKAQRLMAESA